MGLIFGAVLPVAPTNVDWFGLTMKWIGWDGSEWTLTDESDGTVLMPGVRGLNMPPIIHHRAAHASVPGARWRGSTVDVRPVFWPLQVFCSTSSADWIARDSAFWGTMDPTRTGTWVVITPDGRQRRLQLRFTDDTDFSMNHDSVLEGWSNYGITLNAEQPYWEGDPLGGLWSPGTSSQFFGGTGAPSFYISPGGTLAEAAIDNPGDVQTYVLWQIYGPISSATVGVNGRNITIPFAIADGQMLEIDTDPRAQQAMQGPVGGELTVDMTGSLGAIDFAPLPPKQTVNLSLSMSGTGEIAARFTPLYYRAW
ncbi:MAG TPA: hypothetical protein DCR15_14045 [Arthrobacter bacterium]|nr:hypothetical protein [Arthrobacter sp.]